MTQAAPNTVSEQSAFHPGERQVQSLAGVREEAEKRGQRMLTRDINAQQATFFRQLPFVVASHVDESGQPWASLLTGEPGFIGIDEAQHQASITHDLTGNSPAGNPNGVRLQEGSDIGLLGIELATRRRNRLNASVTTSDSEHTRLRIQQAYGNCPKYINERPWPADRFAGQYSLEETDGLGAEAQQLAIRTDTFFIATSSGVGPQDEAATQASAWGADISHRGGEPGFLQLIAEQLVFEDYPGNNMFNTLGNISRHPACGLLLLDFDSGDIVQLAASAQIRYTDTGRSTELAILRTRFWRAEN